MSFWSKLVKPVGIGLGAAALGSILFPETTGMLTGGLLGSSASPGVGGIGPVADGSKYADMLNGGASIWSNPTVLSAGILAGTSLLGGLFGPEASQAEYLREQSEANAAEAKRQFDAELAYKQAALAQAKEIAMIQAGAARSASSGAGAAAKIAADAMLKKAKSDAIMQAGSMKSQALQIPLAAIDNQAKTAQNTGAQANSFFGTLASTLATPALSVAR